jgi:tetratricopeptide (TPR) repeat protein
MADESLSSASRRRCLYSLMWLNIGILVILLPPIRSHSQTSSVNPRPGERVVKVKNDSRGGLRLESGTALTESLAGSQTRSYLINARAGQYIRIIVEQQGIDVEVALLSANNEVLTQVNNANGTRGPEQLSLLASREEIFRINVKAVEPKPKPAFYLIRIAEQRDSMEGDLKRVNAERALAAGEVLRARESYSEALVKYHVAHQLYQELGDKAGAALALLDMGKANYFLLNMEEAVQKYEAALKLFAAANIRLDEGVALLYIGMAKLALGKNAEALTYYDRALELFNKENDQRYRSFALNEIGRTYYLRGDFNKALDHYNLALPIREELNDRKGESFTRVSIGRVYSNGFGSDALAQVYYKKALTLQREIGNRRLITQTLGDIGRLSYKAGDYTTALAHYNDALRTIENGDPSVRAEILMYIGLVYSAWGRQREAIERYFNEALRLQEGRDPIGLARTRQHIGRAYVALGDDAKALDYLEAALEAWQKALHRTAEAETRYQIALVENKRGKFAEACKQIELALPTIEALRSGIVNRALRTNYFASVQNYYEIYIDSLMRLSRESGDKKLEALALNMSEKKRARALLDLLIESKADLRQTAPEPELLSKEAAIQQELSVLSLRQITGEHLTLDQVEKLQSLITEFYEVDAEILKKNPHYAGLTRPSPPSLERIQSELLARDQMLLEYSLGAERSYLWAVTHTSIKSYVLPGRNTIEAAVTQVMKLLTARNDLVEGETEAARNLRIERADAGYRAAAASLAKTLGLDRVTSDSGIGRLLIVSDGELQYLPFAALLVPPRSGQKRDLKHSRPSSFDYGDNLVPLLVDYEIEQPQSMSVVAELRRHPTQAPKLTHGKTIAVIADPVFSASDVRCCTRQLQRQGIVKNTSDPAPSGNGRPTHPFAKTNRMMAQAAGIIDRRGRIVRLGFTGVEAKEILSLVSPEERLEAVGFDANLQLLTNDKKLSSYRILHFATHGWLNPEHPELSGILLSLIDQQGRQQNGVLQMHQIFNLSLPAEMVVISACETGIGRKIGGEGLNGLSRGFMYAGAKRIVASLWKVNDASTSQLMKYFYERLGLREGLDFDRTRPATALRTAQLQMMGQRIWRHPYYWAAFIIHGDTS